MLAAIINSEDLGNHMNSWKRDGDRSVNVYYVGRSKIPSAPLEFFDRNLQRITGWLKMTTLVRIDDTVLGQNSMSIRRNGLRFLNLAIWVQAYVDEAVN